MTFLSRFFYAGLLGTIVALSACAGSASKHAAPEAVAAPVATSPMPAEVVPATPQPAATPGGFWPPQPESTAVTDTGATTSPALSRLSTETIDLKADRNPNADLEHRVIERWALLIAKQGDLAFDYLTPGYQKSHDRMRYQRDMASRPVHWIRAVYVKAECPSETSCGVQTRMDYKIQTAGFATGVSEMAAFAFVSERWLQVDGIWYHLPRETGG